MSEHNISVINDGDFAILQRGSANQLFQISNRKPVFLTKPNQKLSMNHIIGHPYGQFFEIKGKNLIPVEETKPDLTVQIEASAQDNRHLIDDGQSQMLTKEEIEALKLEGASSDTIVKSLVENSSTFNSKTQYSQEKYVKKKKDKYGNRIRILKINLRLLSELYHHNGPAKICNLRIDVLSIMMGAANVMSSGKYLVVDSCLGLLVAAVLDRIMLEGKVVQVYMEAGPVSSYRQALQAMNFKMENLKNILFGISYQSIVPKNQNSEDKTNDVSIMSKTTDGVSVENISDQVEVDEKRNREEGHCHSPDKKKAKLSVEKISDCSTELLKSDQVGTMEVDEKRNDEDGRGRNTDKKKAKLSRKLLRQAETDEALHMMKDKNLDGLLLCCRESPGPVAVTLLNYLAPSRPFAIQSMSLQPLVEAYDLIKTSNQAIFLNLTESWMRKYQVLPDRTHPEVSQSNTSGYLLTGIKVEPVCK